MTVTDTRPTGDRSARKAAVHAQLRQKWGAAPPKQRSEAFVSLVKRKKHVLKAKARKWLIEHTLEHRNRDFTAEEMQTVLGDLATAFGWEFDVFVELGTALARVGKLEVVNATKTGGAVIRQRDAIREGQAELKLMAEKAGKLAERLEKLDPRDLPEFHREYDVYREQASQTIAACQQRANAAEEVTRSALEFEAMKAWVVQNPSEEHKRLEEALAAVDQGIAVVGAAATVTSVVPEPTVKSVSSALSFLHAGLSLAKTVTDKALIAHSNKKQVENYSDENVVGTIYSELGRDPLLVAQMLAEKRVAQVKFALDLTKPFVGIACDTAGVPLSGVWSTVCTVVVGTVEAYQKQRLEAAKPKKESTPEGQREQITKAVQALGGDILEDLKEKVTHELAAVLVGPMAALSEAVVGGLAKSIARAVFENLPVNPAEELDGAALNAHVHDVMDARLRVVLERFAGGDPPGETGGPAEDSPGTAENGMKVRAFLTGPRPNAEGRRYRNVRMEDGELYRLYLDGRELRPMPSGSKAKYASVPTEDAHGRPVDEVRNAGDGPDGRGRYRVRIGDVWGDLTVATKVFVATDPDPAHETDWSQRFVDPAKGYYAGTVPNAATLVEGTWHKPWPARHVYLFRPADGSPREWARSHQKTGNPGNRRIEHALGGANLPEYTERL